MVLDIIRTEKIYQNAFKYICENSTNLTLPYHNIEHSLCVFEECYEASEYYKLDEIYGDGSTKELCLAALFHDTNHSGGLKTDNYNIKTSIIFFKKWFDTNKITDINIKNVIKYIESTEFPYKENGDNLTIFEKIIRDSDMLSSTNDYYFQKTIFGLNEEFKINNIYEQTINQINFIISTKMNTNWGKKKWDISIGSTLSNLNILKDILIGKDISIRDYKSNNDIDSINKEKIDNLDEIIQGYIK